VCEVGQRGATDLVIGSLHFSATDVDVLYWVGIPGWQASAGDGWATLA
jgi:hypothetical protein